MLDALWKRNWQINPSYKQQLMATNQPKHRMATNDQYEGFALKFYDLLKIQKKNLFR